jgi:hypothetical protein
VTFLRIGAIDSSIIEMTTPAVEVFAVTNVQREATKATHRCSNMRRLVKPERRSATVIYDDADNVRFFLETQDWFEPEEAGVPVPTAQRVRDREPHVV